ncbi:AAA family ATPase [Candidatus Micrarchaeota archaeon]|nr:AAA family ATPase [Candidatus Micrarchaeota archaeon]MBU2477288.1 AAA family ATPase [Candidatus Micrarchaeota archaeon]
MEKEAIVTRVLENNSENLKKLENIKKKRLVFKSLLEISKEKEYFLGITGLRGIGKTILLLQLTKENNGVYFSADDRELRGIDLYDIITALSEAGHSKIFIDEIHTKPNWDNDLKSVFDEKKAHICFTGSSSVKLKTLKSDLSRRAVIEHLKPASFREWLEIKKNVSLPLLSLKEIIKKKVKLAREFGYLHKQLSVYYAHGGVLYDAKTGFHKTILSTIETIVIKDLSVIREVDPDIEESFFKLLYLIANSKPLELSYSKIGETVGKNRTWVMRFLLEIEKTEVIKRVYAKGNAMQTFRKEAKYYLPFPYRSALCESQEKKPDVGSLREEFFINHIECNYIKSSKEKTTADFKVKNKTFEVGGKGKNRKQKADYRVVDGLDTTANKIPLFLIGLTY